MVITENERKLMEKMSKGTHVWHKYVSALRTGIQQTKSLYKPPVPISVLNILEVLGELEQLFKGFYFIEDPVLSEHAYFGWYYGTEYNGIKHYYRDNVSAADGPATPVFALYSLSCYKEEVSKRLEILKNYLDEDIDSFCSEIILDLSEIIKEYCVAVNDTFTA